MSPRYSNVWAAAEVARNPKASFVFFWGHRPRPDGVLTSSVFSQWYPARFTVEGQDYPTAEHWMMAQKARLFGDDATRAQILTADSPGKAKALGRQGQPFDGERWDAAAYEVVLTGSRHKYRQNPELAQHLLETGTKILAEASPQDHIWGIGLARDHPDAPHPGRWPGTNLLGFALMELRDELKETAP